MNLEAECNKLVQELSGTYSPELVISLMDLTLLDEQASDTAIRLMEKKASTYPLAGLCLFPHHFIDIKTPATCKRITVVNFPQGEEPISTVLLSLEKIVNSFQIDEIDYVFPYSIYLEGQQSQALSQCKEAYHFCKQQGMNFKVILETGVFNTAQSIYQLSQEVIEQGCDFIKTSTGKTPVGATPLAAFSILQAIKTSGTHCGIKLSGGIKKPEQAYLYMKMARAILNRELNNTWFRIGASSLLDELISPE